MLLAQESISINHKTSLLLESDMEAKSNYLAMDLSLVSRLKMELEDYQASGNCSQNQFPALLN